MYGLQFIRVEPTEYVLVYRRGRLVREGAGLAFFYFAPTTSVVRVPIGSVDAPFMFEEVTGDFQSVTLQGQLTYRVADARKLSALLNYTVAPDGRRYVSDDPTKLSQRLINHAQVLARAALKGMTLRQALGGGNEHHLVPTLRAALEDAGLATSLGVEVLDLAILAIKPTPETGRALEAEAREDILRAADEAIYARRNAAVEQERAIQENELDTEITVAVKQREIRETEMDAERAVQEKQREMKQADLTGRIAREERRRQLVALAAENARAEADASAYGISASMNALGDADPRTLQALVTAKMDPAQLIADAFRGLAADANKIGQLNVAPDLLRELMTGTGSPPTS